MQVSAKADYAVRALVELAGEGGGPIKGDQLAQIQSIPPKFLESILTELRHHGLLTSRRGADGGYWLARPASQIMMADILRATDGPLASVRGMDPSSVTYHGAAVRLTEVWLALQQSLGAVLDHVSLEDVANGALPADIKALAEDPEARLTR